MKPYKITVNIEYNERRNNYKITTPKGTCDLCKNQYEELIGKEVVGEVDFILRKIKGNAADYINPFMVDDYALHSHWRGHIWKYQKYTRLLAFAIDTKALLKWAGDGMFSLEVEYYKEQ